MFNFRPLTLPILLAAACFCAGCQSDQQAYVARHPELSAEQKKMIVMGKLTDQAPVAGMSREQIRMAMGSDPTQLTTINGEDAWVWVKRKAADLSEFHEPERTNTSSGNMSRPQQYMDDLPPSDRPMFRTTVFFQGDKATRVDVTEEQHQ